MSDKLKKLIGSKVVNSSIPSEHVRPVTPDHEEWKRSVDKDRSENLLTSSEGAQRQIKQDSSYQKPKERIDLEPERRSTTPVSDHDASKHKQTERIGENGTKLDGEKCASEQLHRDSYNGRDSFSESDEEVYETRRKTYLDKQKRNCERLNREKGKEKIESDFSEHENRQLRGIERGTNFSRTSDEKAFELRRQRHNDNQPPHNSFDYDENTASRENKKDHFGRKTTTQYHEAENHIGTSTEYDDEQVRPSSVDYENGGYSYRNDNTIIEEYEITEDQSTTFGYTDEQQYVELHSNRHTHGTESTTHVYDDEADAHGHFENGYTTENLYNQNDHHSDADYAHMNEKAYENENENEVKRDDSYYEEEQNDGYHYDEAHDNDYESEEYEHEQNQEEEPDDYDY